MVKSMKRCLRKFNGRTTLRLEELRTLPITYVYDDTEGCAYTLYPSHLFCGRRITIRPNYFHQVVSTQEALTRRTKHHQTLLRYFNIYWRKDYLLSLRKYHSIKRKAHASQSNEVGDVFVLKKDHSYKVCILQAGGCEVTHWREQ